MADNHSHTPEADLSHEEAAEVHTHVRHYWKTFWVLSLMTVVMFGCYFIPMPATANEIAVLGITALKSIIAAFFFMHLIGARKFVHQVLVFTAIFAVFLLGLSLLAFMDHTHVAFF